MNNQTLFRVLGTALFVGGAVLLVSTSVRAQVAGFPDVPANHWAADSVARLAERGIVKGYSADPLSARGAAPPAKSAKPAYNGNKPVTRYELAATLYRFVQYVERADKQQKSKFGAQASPSGADAVKQLIAGGYLPKNTPLASQGNVLVTANQLADAMTQVLSKTREKNTPITPDSLRTQPIERPESAPGT